MYTVQYTYGTVLFFITADNYLSLRKRLSLRFIVPARHKIDATLKLYSLTQFFTLVEHGT